MFIICYLKRGCGEKITSEKKLCLVGETSKIQDFMVLLFYNRNQVKLI